MAWLKWRGTDERGSWNAVWKEAAPELKSGRRTRYKSLSRNEPEARRLLTELNRNLDRSGIGIGHVVGVAELRMKYSAHLKGRNCAAGYLSRVEIVLRHLEAMWPKLKLPQLTADRLDDYKARRLVAGIEASTVNREVAIIKAAVRKARRWQFQIQDLSDVEKLRAVKPAKVAFSVEEVRAMLAAGDAIDRVILFLGIYCGLRRGEMLALPPRLVKLDDGKVVVGLNTRTKTGETRAIPLHRRAARHLRWWLRRLGPGADRVVPWDKSPQALTAKFKALIDRAGLDHGTIHELRHTFVTRLKQLNADTKKVQRMAGHTKESTTDGYTHLDVTDLREAVARLKY